MVPLLRLVASPLPLLGTESHTAEGTIRFIETDLEKSSRTSLVILGPIFCFGGLKSTLAYGSVALQRRIQTNRQR
jgi:hypothetical protein